VENFSLTSVELYRCNIEIDGISALAQAIAVNKFVTYLGLSRNKFQTKGGVILAEAMKINQTITTLDMSWNELRDEFAIAFAEALTMNNSLQRIILDRNRITSDGLSVLAHTLASNRKLRYLGLAGNSVTAVGAGFLAKAVTENRHQVLNTIDIGSNGIAPEGVFGFCNHLANLGTPSKALTTLNLSYNKIGSSVVMLGSAILNLPFLRELNVECAHLTDSPEFRSFCTCLSKHRAICNFAISRNALGDSGVDVLCEAMTGLPAVHFLDLSETGIGIDGIESVTKLLRNARIRTLHLSDNDFHQQGCGAAIATLMAAGGELRYIGLQRCRLGNYGIEGLSTQLQFKPLAVTGISLRGNAIGDAGFAQFLPLVLHHGNFEFIDLACNNLTGFVQPRFPDIFQTNAALPYIVVEDHTVIDRENVGRDWADVQYRSPVNPRHPRPPVCDASMELQQGIPPSAGFATYSLSCGSMTKRQLEENSNALYGLIPFAGFPVKQCAVWDPAKTAPTPNLRGKNSHFRGPSDVTAVAAYENNIGALLVSDDQLRREFNRLDVNGNGYLDVSEFKQVYKTFDNFGVPMSEAEVDRVYDLYGGGTGKISFDFFCVMMLKFVQH
jgi:Ran GTPase-activating protein (RanGAP) involved in mRNA processing and transport